MNLKQKIAALFGARYIMEIWQGRIRITRIYNLHSIWVKKDTRMGDWMPLDKRLMADSPHALTQEFHSHRAGAIMSSDGGMMDVQWVPLHKDVKAWFLMLPDTNKVGGNNASGAV